MILAQAGRFGGWSLYLKDGKPTFTYNFVGLQGFNVAASEPLAAGKATIRYEFVSDGGGMGKGGIGTIFVNGGKVAEGRIEHTQCCAFSLDDMPTWGWMRAHRSRKTTSSATTSSPARSTASRSI